MALNNKSWRDVNLTVSYWPLYSLSNDTTIQRTTQSAVCPFRKHVKFHHIKDSWGKPKKCHRLLCLPTLSWECWISVFLRLPCIFLVKRWKRKCTSSSKRLRSAVSMTPTCVSCKVMDISERCSIFKILVLKVTSYKEPYHWAIYAAFFLCILRC